VFPGDLRHLEEPQLALVLDEGPALHVSPRLVRHLAQKIRLNNGKVGVKTKHPKSKYGNFGLKD
jgi:hypothetical protein